MSDILASRAQKLRRAETPAEKSLWAMLRNRQLCGAKFRRQVAISGYIVDFICYDAKLILELDGAPHRVTQQQDLQRTQSLRALDFEVLRFWNNDVLQDPVKVTNIIQSRLRERMNPLTPTPLPQGERG
jgi:very-short-patch-repair endonuclease